MKKVFVILILVLFLSGCKDNNNVTTNNQSFLASAEWNSQKIECEIKCKNQIYTFKIIKPEQLCGMSITVNNDQYTINYLGLEYKNDIGGTVCSMAELISDILKKCDNTKIKRLQGESYGYEWTALTDGGFLKEIICEEPKVNIKIYKK